MGTRKNSGKRSLHKAMEGIKAKGRRKGRGQAQKNERSRRIVPPDAAIHPHDTIKDAEARWDTESPATPGQPNRTHPFSVDEKPGT